MTDMLTSVVPIIILLGFWWFFMSRMRGTQNKQGDYIAQVKVYLSEHLAETRRMNDSLERIANTLDKKNS